MRLGHIVNLESLGGVEVQFAEFAAHTRHRHEIDHALLMTDRRIHDYLDKEIRAVIPTVLHSQHLLGRQLPRKPQWVRDRFLAESARRLRTDVQLFWNRLTGGSHALAEARAFEPEKNIFWDHGASWLAPDNTKARSMLAHMGQAISNSWASKRMLELRWNFTGPITVCRNALRPSLVPPSRPLRTLERRRPLRLGIAARLLSLKGIASAIHAIPILRARGMPVELHIAGDGPDRDALYQLGCRLGVDSVIFYQGLVRDMGAFYAGIDCLVHLSLREPFGGVLVEAMAHGCPVIATRIDGMAEIVRDGVDGRSLAPTLSISDYRNLDAPVHGLPDYVYDPDVDDIVGPRAVNPEDVAEAVQYVFRDEATYAAMSDQAARRVMDDFAFSDHADEVMRVLRPYEG